MPQRLLPVIICLTTFDELWLAMDPSNYPQRGIPLHLVFFSILSASNSPLFLHSSSGKQDELRYWHLSRGALDTVEERGRIASSQAKDGADASNLTENMPSRPSECYLG